MSHPLDDRTYDFVIVGSGFGGSVSAMRLAQKGHSVALLEMGRDYKNTDFPKTNWDIFNYLWAPIIRCFGIQKISLLSKVMVLHGVGVGGGSLVYANTLMKPKDHVFDSKFWPQSIKWAQELAPFYETAKKMLGVTTNKVFMEGEKALKKVGERLGVADTFKATEVGIYFGTPGEKVKDPYFNGAGPDREGCSICGSCMIGCPTGSKNTLDKNYLYFAKKWGVKIFSETKVTKITPDGDSYLIDTVKSTSLIQRKGRSFKAKKVILSAGVLGTMDILLKNKFEYQTLPNISDQLGHTVRTNGESLLGATSLNSQLEMEKGIAIGSHIQVDEHTKIENVRYPAGSDFMRFLAVPLTGNGSFITRPFKMVLAFFKNFIKSIKVLLIKDWAKSTVILLVMQSLETKMKLSIGRSALLFGKKVLKGRPMSGETVPSYIPIAQKAAKVLEEEIDGVAQNIAPEVLLQTPATAHILGGAIIGEDHSKGVIDTNHEVFGHPGLYICDGSVIPSNLAVNPSLTISALAERFTQQFPCKSNHLEEEIEFSSN